MRYDHHPIRATQTYTYILRRQNSTLPLHTTYLVPRLHFFARQDNEKTLYQHVHATNASSGLLPEPHVPRKLASTNASLKRTRKNRQLYATSQLSLTSNTLWQVNEAADEQMVSYYAATLPRGMYTNNCQVR